MKLFSSFCGPVLLCALAAFGPISPAFGQSDADFLAAKVAYDKAKTEARQAGTTAATTEKKS